MQSNFLTRRSFLGLGLGGALSALTGVETHAQTNGKAKQVLVIFEQGGVSHIDTWDPKPDAPTEHRSPFKQIKTKASGIYVTELLAQTARVMDKFTVVRCMTQPTPGIGNSHPKGSQYIFSGEAPGGPVDMPDIGSVVAQRMGTRALYLPSNILLPAHTTQVVRASSARSRQRVRSNRDDAGAFRGSSKAGSMPFHRGR